EFLRRPTPGQSAPEPIARASPSRCPRLPKSNRGARNAAPEDHEAPRFGGQRIPPGKSPESRADLTRRSETRPTPIPSAGTSPWVGDGKGGSGEPDCPSDTHPASAS